MRFSYINLIRPTEQFVINNVLQNTGNISIRQASYNPSHTDKAVQLIRIADRIFPAVPYQDVPGDQFREASRQSRPGDTKNLR